MGSANEDLLHGRLRRRPARVNQVAQGSGVVRAERLCPSGKPEVTELLPVCDDPSRIHAGFPERLFWTMRMACPVT